MPRSRSSSARLIGISILAAFAALGALFAVPGTRAGEPSPAAPAAPAAEWLADPGTAVLGLGLLRVAPSKAGVPGTLTLRYEERPTDYAAFDSLQLMVLPGDAFAADGRCFADKSVVFGRSETQAYRVDAVVQVDAPALLVVGYGPFVGPDTGRPLSLARAYTLEITAATGVSHRWIDPEAGELNVKGWTNRPDVKRGGSVLDPVAKAPHWFEARPEILYDRDRLKAPGDPETADTAARRREADSLASRAKDLRAAGKADVAKELEDESAGILRALAASDDRMPVPAALAARMRHLPFRWK